MQRVYYGCVSCRGYTAIYASSASSASSISSSLLDPSSELCSVEGEASSTTVSFVVVVVIVVALSFSFPFPFPFTGAKASLSNCNNFPNSHALKLWSHDQQPVQSRLDDTMYLFSPMCSFPKSSVKVDACSRVSSWILKYNSFDSRGPSSELPFT